MAIRAELGFPCFPSLNPDHDILDLGSLQLLALIGRQRSDDLRGALIAVFDFGGQAPHDDLIDLPRDFVVLKPGRRDLALLALLEDLKGIRIIDGRSPDNSFIKNTAKRIDVGGIRGLPQELLRSHIRLSLIHI